MVEREPMQNQALDLSVCMIVKNESRQIAEALSNFRVFADEIVVVDTGSTDSTRTIVERFTPRLFHFEWCDDFSAARNFSLQQARGRYIVWLDADDRLDREMQQKVRMLKTHLDGDRAFYFVLHDTNAQGVSRSCYQLRCLPRKPGICFHGRVHEQVYPSVVAAGLKTVTTDIVISHYGYHDESLSLQKTRRNLALLERERDEGRDDEHIHYYLATSYRLLGLDMEAIGAMERALIHLEKQLFHLPQGIEKPDFRPTLEAYLFLAPLYLTQGNHQQALRCMTRADAMGPKDALCHFRVGCLYQELNQHALAINHFGSSLKVESDVGFHPSSPPPARTEILLFTAYSLLCLDQQTHTQQALQKACESGLQMHEAWEWLGFHALRLKHFTVSLRAYENAQTAGELSADGCCNLGILYNKNGLPQKALTCHQAALQKDPNHQDARANAAHLYLSLGDMKDAKGAFQQLVGQGARDVDILLGLTLIAVRERDWELAQTTTQILKESPSLRDSGDRLRDELFYGDIARLFSSQNKPRLAEWAKEIALGLREAVFCNTISQHLHQ
jgi:glycosyltransferase involved in cell wall biosynthesis